MGLLLCLTKEPITRSTYARCQGDLALVGVALGVFAAAAVTRLLSAMLYKVTANDPVTFGLVALFFTFVALAACYLPARRAMKVDPVVALRYE